MVQPHYLLARVGVAALWLGIAPAHASDELEIIGLSGSDPQHAALITESGQVLVEKNRVWRHAGLGGVATRLRAASGAGPNDVLAVGSHAPPYRFDGRAWTAVPIRQRALALIAAGPGDAMVIGRRIYLRQGTRWHPLPPNGARTITAAWSTGQSNVAIATGKADVRIWRGAGWTTVPLSLASPTERIDMLFSLSDGTLVAAGDEGTLLSVSNGRKKSLPLDARLASFRPLLTHSPMGGPLTIVGYGIVSGRSRLVVSRIHTTNRGKIVMLLDYVPTTQKDDEPVALLSGKTGAILLATRHGLLLRRTAGGTWSREQVTPKPMSRAPARKNPPARPK